MDSILPIIVGAVVAVLAIAYLFWRARGAGAQPGRAQSAPPRQSRPPSPQRSEAPFDLTDGADVEADEAAGALVLDVDVTQMGEVPTDFLAELEKKLAASEAAAPEEEVSVEVDLKSLEGDSLPEEPTSPYALILATGFARSDVGRKRPCNEDAFLLLEDEPLFVVADGMGGHAAGDVASKLAVETIERAFKTRTFDGPFHKGWPRRGDELARAIHMANAAVYELSRSDPKLGGMGTTVVAARFASNKQRVYIANVGDSRCYRIRDGELTQLTTDHTLGAVLGITGKKARHLTQSVGIRPWVSVDLTTDRPEPDDQYLVCSDGLTKMVDDATILRLALEVDDLEQKARALVDEANARGGRDNITVVAIRVDSPSEMAERAGF